MWLMNGLGMQKLQMYRLWRVLTGCSARRKTRRLALLNKWIETTQCARQCRRKRDICNFCIPENAWPACGVGMLLARQLLARQQLECDFHSLHVRE